MYFETSYKATNRVFSSAALESGTGDLRIQVIDDLNGIAGSNYTSSVSPVSQSPGQLFKQGYSVTSLEEPIPIVPDSAHLISGNISVTGPKGMCLSFYYSVDGLSAEKLRVLVKDVDSDSNQTLWESSSESEGNWTRAAVAYAYETTHQVRNGMNSPDFSRLFICLIPAIICAIFLMASVCKTASPGENHSVATSSSASVANSFPVYSPKEIYVLSVLQDLGMKDHTDRKNDRR